MVFILFRTNIFYDSGNNCLLGAWMWRTEIEGTQDLSKEYVLRLKRLLLLGIKPLKEKIISKNYFFWYFRMMMQISIILLLETQICKVKKQGEPYVTNQQVSVSTAQNKCL